MTSENLPALDALTGREIERTPARQHLPAPSPATEPRAVVTWEGPGQPIVLTVYGPAGEVAVPLLPKRALTLAQELLTRGVQAIKNDIEVARTGE